MDFQCCHELMNDCRFKIEFCNRRYHFQECGSTTPRREDRNNDTYREEIFKLPPRDDSKESNTSQLLPETDHDRNEEQNLLQKIVRRVSQENSIQPTVIKISKLKWMN